MIKFNRSIRATVVALVGLSVMFSLVAGNANAQNKRLILKTVSFQENEAGMLHGSVTADKHNCCAVGMNNAFGHYTKTIAWTTVTTQEAKGVVECKFSSGDALYGNVSLSAPDVEGYRNIAIQFTGGTGSLAYTSGTATGKYHGTTPSLGAETYTGALNGVLIWHATRIPDLN